MGSELVKKPSTPRISAEEQFKKAWPYYLAIGMTSKEYWESDATLTLDYWEADRIRTEKINQQCWLMGLYVYEAVCDVAPVLHAFAKRGTKPLQYSKEPYPIFQEEREQKQEQHNQDKLRQLRDRLIKDAMRNGK